MSRRLLWLLPILAFGSLTVGEDAPAPAPPKELPPGRLGEVVALGKELVERTNEHPLTKNLRWATAAEADPQQP